MLLAVSVIAFFSLIVAISYWLAFQRRYGAVVRGERRTRN